MNQPTETAGAATANEVPQSETQATQASVTKAPRKRSAKVVPAVATREATVAEPAKTDGDKPLIGASTANVPDAMREAAKSVAKLNAENARLQGLLKREQGEIAKLRAVVGSGGETAKVPVTDAELRKAADYLIAATRADPSKPKRSLASVLVMREARATFVEPKAQAEGETGVLPDLGKGDGSQLLRIWKPARAQIDAMHTAWTRNEAPKLISVAKRTLRKAVKNPASVQASGGYFVRGKGKDAKRIGARISVKEKAQRAPGTGKGAAKPTVTA